jgi:hypothetical protein
MCHLCSSKCAERTGLGARWFALRTQASSCRDKVGMSLGQNPNRSIRTTCSRGFLRDLIRHEAIPAAKLSQTRDRTALCLIELLRTPTSPDSEEFSLSPHITFDGWTCAPRSALQGRTALSLSSIPQPFLLPHALLACRKTGRLPEIRHWHLGSVI